MQSDAWWVECAAPSPLAGHAVNPSVEARWRHPCRHTVPQSARTPHQTVAGCLVENQTHPTISTGPCPPTAAGPYAAWMPRKSLQGRTCGVSCEGGRARTLQPSCSTIAQQLTCPFHSTNPQRCRVEASFGYGQKADSFERTVSSPERLLAALSITDTPDPRLVLARPPSRDLTRHGCRVRAYRDVLAACPAMVGGQGPCSQVTAQRPCNKRT